MATDSTSTTCNRADYVMGQKDRFNTHMASYPWFDWHITFGDREIFQWTHGQGEKTSVDGVPHIGGAVWVSREAMVAHYKAEEAAGYPEDSEPVHLMRYVPEVGFFATREEAETWLFSEAT